MNKPWNILPGPPEQFLRDLSKGEEMTSSKDTEEQSPKMVCPTDPSHKEFCASAVVAQSWLVDGNGEFLEVTDDCSLVYSYPDTEEEWTCNECGEVAIMGVDHG